MSHAEQDEAARFDALVAAKNEEATGIPADDSPPEATNESDNEPAPEAGSSVVGDANPDDIDLESLPPAVRARIERAAQLEKDLARERNDRIAAVGRLQPTQRKLAELERKLQSAPQATSAASSPPPAAAPVVGSPKWDKWASEFPDEAEAILERTSGTAAELADLKQQLAQLRQNVEPRLGNVDSIVRENTKTRELAVLQQAHPDWQELVQPTETDAVQIYQGEDGAAVYVNSTFAEWLLAQDEDKQRWFGSDSAVKNSRLLDDYKRDLYIAQLHDAPPPEQGLSPEATKAARAHQLREQARASSVAPDLRGGSTAAARVDTSQMSPEDKFDWLVAQRRKAR